MKLIYFYLLLFILINIFPALGTDLNSLKDSNVFTNDFAVEINGNFEVADDVASSYGFKLLRHVKSLGSVYHFVHDNISKRSKRSADDIKIKLESDPNVIWVEQQKLLLRSKRSIKKAHKKMSSDDFFKISKIQFNDPFFKDQWYLVNRGQTGGIKGHDLNVLSAWMKGYSGKGVVVSVLDDGVDHTHPDLQANYDPLASADLNDHKDKMNDPMPNDLDPYNNHGTRCAGEIAAQANNSNCCVGVAFNANIGGIRMLDGVITDLLEGESLLYHNQHIDIYSASWGPNDDGQTMEGPFRYCKQALEDGTSKGRGGRGSIFVWATGNGGMVGDDCSCDGYVSSIYTLSIGSVTNDGMSTYYSEVCPSVMAVVFTGGSHVAPGEEGFNSGDIKVITTDLHGECTLKFQGTSSAAPLAAGCIALVLEANPNLTWRDIQHIVVETSVIPSEHEGGWVVNGAGYHVNHRFGFGALDCSRMVEAAEGWTNVQEQHKCIVKSSGPPRILYRGSTISEILSTTSCNSSTTPEESRIQHLEHVVVHVKLTHERRGDVTISLISPLGTTSNLLKVRPLDKSTDGIDFDFMTVHNWGENPIGNWNLIIKDNSAEREGDQKMDDGTDEKVGFLTKWSLIMFGVNGELKNHQKWIGTDGVVQTLGGKATGTRLETKRRKLEDGDEDDGLSTLMVSSSTSSPSSLFSSLPSSMIEYLKTKTGGIFSLKNPENDESYLGNLSTKDESYFTSNDSEQTDDDDEAGADDKLKALWEFFLESRKHNKKSKYSKSSKHSH